MIKSNMDKKILSSYGYFNVKTQTESTSLFKSIQKWNSNSKK